MTDFVSKRQIKTLLIIFFSHLRLQGPVSFRDGDRVGVTQVEQLQGKDLDKNQVFMLNDT